MKLGKYFFTRIFFSLMLMGNSSVMGQANWNGMKSGDIVFQDLNCGPFCDAIKKVTEGVDGRDFAHCGVLVQEQDASWHILEAVQAGVVLTPLSTFLSRSVGDEVVLGRLNASWQHLLPSALIAGRKLVGKPYDSVFDMENDAYYCSEMIYKIFQQANNGKPIFSLYPMTYKDPDTNETFPAWVDYFEKLATKIPEGEPGLNPGSLSKEDKLDIFIMQRDEFK